MGQTYIIGLMTLFQPYMVKNFPYSYITNAIYILLFYGSIVLWGEHAQPVDAPKNVSYLS